MRFPPQRGVLLASIPYTREKGVAPVEVCTDVQYPCKAKEASHANPYTWPISFI